MRSGGRPSPAGAPAPDARPGRAVLGAAGALRGLLLVVLALAGGCGSERDLPRALREFLQGGPGPGTWEVQGLSTRTTTWIAPHPDDSGWMLKAVATPEGVPVRPCVALRSSVARQFLEGPWDLFARNYTPQGPAEASETRSGQPALRLRWVPRVPAGDTARHVWFDPDSGAVLQIEDVAVQAQRVRGIYRLSASTGGLDPSAVHPGGPGGEDLCVESEPESMTLSALRSRLPFALLVPAYLPPGYERIGARYEELPRGDSPAAPPIRLASLTYSDGLGLISLGIADRADMDALQERLAGAMSGEEASGGCSTPPPEAGAVAVRGGRVLRRRVDVCRTVLRLDGVEGVSVTLLSRNELPGDEYVKVMESLGRPEAP